MNILLQKPGILTTVQDLGRQRFRRFGVNPSGVMDATATRLINASLGNDDNEAVLEMHFPAAQIVFEASTVATIGGGDFTPILDDDPIENWRPFVAKKGSVLKFTGKTSGNRAYLAVQGGFKTNEWLDSASTNLTAQMGGFKGRKLEGGDRIKLNQKSKKLGELNSKRIASSIIPMYGAFPTVRIVAGAEFEFLSDTGRELLLDQNFTISNNSNRMGFRLVGGSISLSKPREFISSAVSFGTIQILPDGHLIVLMADHQTSGGYPRLAHVITHDLPLVAQLGANDKVAFHLVGIEDAENLALQFERELNFLRVGCRFHSNK